MTPCVAVNSGACFWLHLDSREQIVGLLLLRVRGRIDVEGQFVGSGIPASARGPDEGTEVEEQGVEAMDPRSAFESLGVAFWSASLERVAGATGSRVFLASWSSSQYRRVRQASIMCH